MSCESKDELNGEKGTTTEQKSKETERKFTIKDSVEFPTDGTSGNEDQASAHSDADRVLKTDPEKAGIEKIIPVKNGVTGSSTEYMGNETSLQSASSQKVTNISVSEEGKNNATTETHFDSGNETIITSEIDGYPDKIGCFQETHEEIDTKCISNELKRSIVDNVVNRYIQDAKKPRTEVESPNEVTGSDCSETSDYLLSSANTVDGDFQSSQVSEFGESQASIADTQKEVGKSVTRGIFAKLDNNATSGDPAANLAHKNVKEDENEAGVLLKESAGSMTVTEDLKSDICTKDSQNDLECPHLESEASVELDFPSIDMEINRTIAAESPVKKLDEKMNKSVDIGLKLETVSELRNGTKQELFSKSQYEADQQLGRSRPSTPVVESKKVVNCMQTCKDAFSSANQNNTEKVIVYHEDTIRIVEKNKEPTYDKENNVDTAQKDPQETKNKSSVETANTSSALCRNKAILESKKLSDPSPYKPKGQKLDELVSKIATKASNLNIPKKAKARKSFSQSSTGVEKAAISSMPVAASAITSLTFNVKMLEKQGVLDIPKTHNKRKAFEPFKLKVKQPEKVEKSSVKVSPVRSPMKSPKDSPFFNTSKVIKGRRRKKKKMGSYRLPSEKKIRERQTKSRERKKASEERQLSDDEKSDRQQDLDSDRDDIEKKKETDSFEIKSMNDVHDKTEAVLEQKLMQEISAKSVDSSGISPKQQNALDMLTKNAKLSFTLNPNLNLKKAKKTVRPAVNHNSQTRTLDSFLKGDTVAKLTSTLQQNHGQTVVGSTGIQQTQEPQDQTNSSVRKRKADEENILLDKTPPDTIIEGHEEKKRKTEIPMGKSPPPVINILTGSPPLAGGIRPIIPASVSPSSAVTFTHINTPNSKQQPKTLIQNGTLNGMPVFQIISNGNFGPPQLVAIGTQGQSLLPSSLPKTAILQSPPRLPGAPAGMPVILTPVPMQTVVSSAIVSQAQNQVSLLSLGSGGSTVNIPSKALLSPVNSLNQATTMTPTVQQIAVPTPLSVFNQSILPSPSQANGQMPVLNHILKSPLEMPTLKPSHIPNGLYPVTPPRTPDEQAGSDTGSQESVGVSPGQQISPEKDIISLCTCKLSGATFPKLAATVTFCQALDSVDRKAMGCCNKVSNSQLVRPAVKIPFMAVCENHRKRLRLHQCCPGCGHFCTQGKFLQCRNEGNQIVHNFHEQCQVIKDGKNYCPHCGETSLQVEVTLMLQEKKPPTIESKSSRIQTKAKMAVADKRGSGDESGEETVVVIEKTKKVLSTSGICVAPDKHSIERVLSSLSQERPKKYRHLPKCLYTPAYDNDLERVVYMLEDGHDPNEKYDDLDGQGAIHAAATVGSLPIVHMLIQAGASPHLQDKTLRTPLMYAAENNNLQVVKYLIKVGAVIDSKSDDGMTSLHYAAKAGHVGVIRILLDIEGINIDVKDDGGYTPLIWASEHEQLDVVKFLLKRNADPNLRDSEENTALHWAAFSGSSNVAEVLLNAGCELDSLNMHGDRPLHIASRQDHYECVVLFLARGADVELENNKGENPMKCCLDQNSPTALALNVNKKLKGFGAKHMGRPEKLLHRDISKGRENIPIPCVNGIDDEGIPTDYLYVTDNIETKCLNINRVIGSLQCCQCKDECSSIYCACGKNSVKCWYDKYGRLLPEFNMLEPSLIFECNRACECWTTCNNRVVQNGVMSRLQVFKTEGRGWGCKTLVNIARGTFICEYIGEHISDSEADRREDDSYLFDLDNKDGETYCIDARKYGNVARFINHLCEPNLVPVKVFVDSQDLRFPRICLFASRDINAQEELGFDYGEKFWIIKWKHFTCTCGSLKCRYSKDTIQKTLEEYRVRHEEDIDITKD